MMIVILIGVLLLVVAVALPVRAVPVFWLSFVLLVPPWIDASLLDVRLAPAAVASLAVVIALWRRVKLTWTSLDSFVVVTVAVLVLAGLLGAPRHVVVQLLGEWFLPYVAGRYCWKAVDAGRASIYATLGIGLALAAVSQVVTSYNVADLVPTVGSGAGDAWKVLQYRNDLPRAEVTIGHAIALGSCLTVALVFALGVRTRWVRFTSVLVISIGVLATQSRAPLLAAALGLVLYALSLAATRATRVLWVAALMMLLAASLPTLIQEFFLGGGDTSSEVTQGSLYRLRLLDVAQLVRPVGLAQQAVSTGDGATFVWGGSLSIDNGPLYLALYLGWIPVLLTGATYLWACRLAWRSRDRLLAIAVLVQLPIFLTVAPIVQHQALVWFVVGGVGVIPAGLPSSKESPPDDMGQRASQLSRSRKGILG